MDGGFERQDGEYAVDISAHRARPARPPSPDRRRDIIEYRNRRQAAAHAARHAVSEIRAVDDDQCVGVRSNHHLGGFADPPQNHRQTPRNGVKADDGQVVDRKRTLDPGRRHRAPADAGKFDRTTGLLDERARQRAAECVAGFFSGNQNDR